MKYEKMNLTQKAGFLIKQNIDAVTVKQRLQVEHPAAQPYDIEAAIQQAQVQPEAEQEQLDALKLEEGGAGVHNPNLANTNTGEAETLTNKEREENLGHNIDGSIPPIDETLIEGAEKKDNPTKEQ